MEYAQSSLAVARYHALQGGGDLLHAKELLEVIANSQCAEVAFANDLLKRVKHALLTRQPQDASPQMEASNTAAVAAK